MNSYQVGGLFMGLAFSAWIVWRLWQAFRNGRIAYWQSITGNKYAERANRPRLYWTSVAWHVACLGLALWFFCISPWVRP